MKIVVVGNRDGDWQGLYVDGELFCEGHQVTPRDVFDALATLGCGVEGAVREATDAEQVVVDRTASMPRKIEG